MENATACVFIEEGANETVIADDEVEEALVTIKEEDIEDAAVQVVRDRSFRVLFANMRIIIDFSTLYLFESDLESQCVVDSKVIQRLKFNRKSQILVSTILHHLFEEMEAAFNINSSLVTKKRTKEMKFIF
jgi:hypothetical protein